MQIPSNAKLGFLTTNRFHDSWWRNIFNVVALLNLHMLRLAEISSFYVLCGPLARSLFKFLTFPSTRGSHAKFFSFFCSTLILYKKYTWNSFSDILLADPTNEEEEISSGSITIVVTSEGKLCMVHKPGRYFTSNPDMV